MDVIDEVHLADPVHRADHKGEHAEADAAAASTTKIAFAVDIGRRCVDVARFWSCLDVFGRLGFDITRFWQ